jgi:hypothetical protein
VSVGSFEWPILQSVKEYYEESGGSITDQEIIDGLRRVDFITIGFSKPSLGTAYANFDNIYIVDYQVPLGNIVIAPPADAAYTASVYGGYYARAFEEDEDETWVSVNAPNALILMAQAYIELKLHNNWAGFQRFEAQALREASERWANVVYEQASLGRPINEQRLGPINFGENTPGRTTYDPYSGGSFQWVDS